MGDVFHILNPRRALRKRVARFFKKRPKLDAAWVERTSHPTHLETIVEWAVREGRRRIAVWGGDGTFGRAVHALYEQGALDDTLVRLVPVGTCNDFARKIGLARPDLSLRGARRAMKKSHKSPVDKGIDEMASAQTTGLAMTHDAERRFDLGRLSFDGGSRVFVNNAGFGRSEEAMNRPRPSALRDILSFSPKRLDLEWEDARGRHFETIEAILGMVVNAPFFNGGMHFDREVSPADGTLAAFFEPPQGRLRLLGRFAKSRLGRPLAGRRTIRLDPVSLRVESDADLFPQADGERVGAGPARCLEYKVLPAALRLLAPEAYGQDN